MYKLIKICAINNFQYSGESYGTITDDNINRIISIPCNSFQYPTNTTRYFGVPSFSFIMIDFSFSLSICSPLYSNSSMVQPRQSATALTFPNFGSEVLQWDILPTESFVARSTWAMLIPFALHFFLTFSYTFIPLTSFFAESIH